MGLLKTIGKMTGSNIVKKVGDEFTKIQNREQTIKYCTYIKNNIIRIQKQTTDLQSETQNLVNEMFSLKTSKKSLKEIYDLKKTKEKVNVNLKYLYLSRDFFITLSKNASGLALKNEELMLVVKFAPYFDGVPVLKLDYEDYDESLLGALKEEFKYAFISSKKSSSHFVFEEYLYRYEEQIKKHIMPDIDVAIESFKNAMSDQEAGDVKNIDSNIKICDSSTSQDEIECSNCHIKIGSNNKFCPECGNKIEIKKPSFCIQCGEAVSIGAKFCANCGAKI